MAVGCKCDGWRELLVSELTTRPDTVIHVTAVHT